jgi:hypothetical protein
MQFTKFSFSFFQLLRIIFHLYQSPHSCISMVHTLPNRTILYLTSFLQLRWSEEARYTICICNACSGAQRSIVTEMLCNRLHMKWFTTLLGCLKGKIIMCTSKYIGQGIQHTSRGELWWGTTLATILIPHHAALHNVLQGVSP